MATLLSFGTLFNIDSTELLNFTWRRTFNIQNVGTVSLIELTQPGNLSPIELNISVTITANASPKFTLFTNILTAKSLEPITFLNRSLGNAFFSDLLITSNELSDDGDILRFDSEMSFIFKQNFG